MGIMRFLQYSVIVAAMITIAVARGGPAWSASPFTPIPGNEVNAAQRDKARQVATDILTAWRDDKYDFVPEDFSDEMKRAFDQARQKSAAAEIQTLFGVFRSLELAEACSSSVFPGIVVYRFRGVFSYGGEKPEVRVVVDRQGKISGFWIKPWNDEIQ